MLGLKARAEFPRLSDQQQILQRVAAGICRGTLTLANSTQRQSSKQKQQGHAGDTGHLQNQNAASSCCRAVTSDDPPRWLTSSHRFNSDVLSLDLFAAQRISQQSAFSAIRILSTCKDSLPILGGGKASRTRTEQCHPAS